jgi:2-keto-3-deoxy-L-rhamnonate aldolase RhmA
MNDSRVVTSVVVAALVGSAAVMTAGQPQKPRRHNPVIALLEQGQPVFGLYAPSNRRGRGGAPPPADAPPPKPASELAKEAAAVKTTDFIFDGSMEGGLDRALPAFTEFVTGMKAAGAFSASPYAHLTHPLIVKTPELGSDFAATGAAISRQLNLGVSGLMFPKVESAEQLRSALAAMRFKSNGGTRPDDVGTAPEFWGMPAADYKRKADLWPLNPEGELINWTIVESKEGLAHVREIAAVKGIGVLWPGAGTLRGLFTTTSAAGERTFDQEGWEAAIQQVLSACKEFKVPCGFPATPNDIEMRMKQGFSVFVMGWGEQGLKAIDIGRKAANRPTE